MQDRDTEFATQLARSPQDYLDARTDIGRAVGNGVRELFVACEVGEALAQQFEHAPQHFIALHDLGCKASRQFLDSVATACGQTIERLMIRRTGYGTVLATIEHVDCPTEDGYVRLYSTDTDADSAARHSISRALMDHAVLSAIMVGEHPAHMLQRLLSELAQAHSTAAYCRDVLLLPFGPPHLLQPHAQAFANATSRTVRLGPRVGTPAQVWTPLRAAWNGLQSSRGEGLGPLLPALSIDVPSSMQRPQPPGSNADRVTAVAPGVDSSAKLPRTVRDLVQPLAAVPGVVALCAFEIATSRVLAQAGPPALAQELARRGTLLLAAAGASRRQLSLLGPALEVVVIGAPQSSAVHMLSTQLGWALHVVFDTGTTDWSALRERLQQLQAPRPHAPRP